MTIGCLGMATLDTLLFIGEPVYDHEAVTPVDETVVSGGGKGVVSAIAMQRCGADVLPFATVGCDSSLAPSLPGALARRYLIPARENDNRTWITVSDAHKVVTFVAKGALAVDLGEVIAEVEKFVASVDALYITIEDTAILRAALQAASKNDPMIALNPSLPLVEQLRREDPGLLRDLTAASNSILCNHWEARRFLHEVGAGDWDRLDAPRLEDIVVTAGENGGEFWASERGEWGSYSATPVDRVRCVVGAGDTFNGAYLTARFAEGLSPERSCERAAELAAVKVGHRGSALPL